MALFGTLKKQVETFIQCYSNDRVGMLSAAFAYVTIFSIGPLLLVLISIVGLVFGEQAVTGKLYSDLANLFGSSTAKTVQHVVSHSQHTSDNVIVLVIGVIG